MAAAVCLGTVQELNTDSTGSSAQSQDSSVQHGSIVSTVVGFEENVGESPNSHSRDQNDVTPNPHEIDFVQKRRRSRRLTSSLQAQHDGIHGSFTVPEVPMSRHGDEDHDHDHEHDDDEDDDDEDEIPPCKSLNWRYRLKHVTWAWFTLTMATGGICDVLHTVPYRFNGLETIGFIFFFLNITLYAITWVMILTRFYLFPYMFKASFLHPTESLFVPAFAVSFGTILITLVEYGIDHVGDWLNHVVLYLFWFDAGLAVILSITIYLILWSTQSFTIWRMTPIWIFPAYPMLIIGSHAANLSGVLKDATEALEVIVGGFTIQGIGFLVSMTIYSSFVYRLMTQKLPDDPLRPGMFVSVGPSAFTVSGTIGMATNLQSIMTRMPGDTFMDVPHVLAAQILRLVANWMSLWLWGLAIWFFFVSLCSNIACFHPRHQMPFAMAWFSFIFPQTALTGATFRIAKAFDIGPLNIVGCVMTCLLVLVWFVVIGAMVRAIWTKQILWPETGEDKSEGGFEMRKEKEEEIVVEWNRKVKKRKKERLAREREKRKMRFVAGNGKDQSGHRMRDEKSWKKRFWGNKLEAV